MTFKVGDRIVGLRGESGVVVEVGIAMRDHRDNRREAVKLNLDATPQFPLGVTGAYRYVETIKLEGEA